MAVEDCAIVSDSAVTESTSSKRKIYCGQWHSDEMEEYFRDIQGSTGIPVYPRNGLDFECPMNVLVPPRMESLFLDHREAVGAVRPLPHALLVRDWPVAGEVEDFSWWRDFVSEKEVEEARANHKADVEGRVVNQFEEHAELAFFGSATRSARFRTCDLGDSFERGRYHQQLFDVWLWKSFYQNPHMFPTLSCLVNMVRLKQLLWNRYGFFFDVDTIQEVYPDEELAEWVINCYKSNDIATPVYRDDEMAFERLNGFFSRSCPHQMRTYGEEVAIQRRRRLFRDSRVEFEHGGVNWFDSRLRRRVFEGEVLPRCLIRADDQVLADRQWFWLKRREPSKAQHDAQEPDGKKWAALSQKQHASSKVGCSSLLFVMLFVS